MPTEISTVPFPVMRYSKDPLFPLEIIQLIIHEVWSLPLTTAERTQFMKIYPLVNSQWLNVFARKSSTHVHLISGSHAMMYDASTFGKSFVYSTLAGMNGFTVRNSARSFTVHCLKPSVKQQERRPTLMYPMGLSSYVFCIRLQQKIFLNFDGQVAIQFSNEAVGLMDLCNVEFPPALKAIRKNALPVRNLVRSSWSTRLSGIQAVHAIPLYRVLTEFAEMATQYTTYTIPLIYEYI
ncbi:hypothetical protein J3R30DRAFT_3421822 [Lentinula aciculospora]|uniref:Uncharacterized protein n=1 Tax=Lentinula aciculospora TaxID=153920 RepID=A0A9W9ATV7_9AGAR|nr:hypothetical protein J3R30DRAFT_3421822 [Lentinula aciculospora]